MNTKKESEPFVIMEGDSPQEWAAELTKTFGPLWADTLGKALTFAAVGDTLRASADNDGTLWVHQPDLEKKVYRENRWQKDDPKDEISLKLIGISPYCPFDADPIVLPEDWDDPEAGNRQHYSSDEGGDFGIPVDELIGHLQLAADDDDELANLIDDAYFFKLFPQWLSANDMQSLIKINTSGRPMFIAFFEYGNSDLLGVEIFSEWSITLHIRFNPEKIQRNKIIPLFEEVGSVGVGKRRPIFGHTTLKGFGKFKVEEIETPANYGWEYEND